MVYHCIISLCLVKQLLHFFVNFLYVKFWETAKVLMLLLFFRWFRDHVAYTMAKYGMSECTLGHAGEFRPLGIAVNSLWPRTAIATAALKMIPGVDLNLCRKPEILADAGWWILTSESKGTTGQFFIDDELLARHGVHELDKYSVAPGTKNFIPDFFVD